MKKIILLSTMFCFFGVGYSRANCLEISDVERPGSNFEFFLETLGPLVEEECNKDISTDLVGFEFSGKKKGVFEVRIDHIPADCTTFGLREAPKCDPYDTARCYSIGTFTLIPKLEEAKKLAKRVAEKINKGNWGETICPEGDPD